MTKVAIVGSRDFPNRPLVEAFVERLRPSTVVVSGRGRGVDRWAEDAAKARGLATDIYPAEWDKYGKAAGFRRNKDIVNACDHLVAFWDGESRGTMHSLDMALEQEKLFVIFLPDGRRMTPHMYREHRSRMTATTQRRGTAA